MKVAFEDLGIVPYMECQQYQRRVFERRLSHCGRADEEGAGTVIFVEHPPVYTLGKRGKESNMLADMAKLADEGVVLYHTDRGGDITFHGKGQVVCYPILDLALLGIGLRRYIEMLEQCVIDTIAEYGICGKRLAGATGVWVCDDTADESAMNWRKICAIGVRASRFVTMHGFALNVNTDLKWFNLINPCGFVDKGVTSMAVECGAPIDESEVKRRLAGNMERVFGVYGFWQNEVRI